jgi:hypothetical protein
MTRVAVIIAASLALAGCSSFSVGDWVPGMSSGGGGGAGIPLALDSDPPGAEARTSAGPGCRTPCTVAVPPADGLTVTFALPGYETQTVPIEVLPGNTDPQFSPSIALSPNPVMAMLQPAAPASKKKGKPKPRTTAPAGARSAPAPAATGTTRSSAPPASQDVPPAQRTIPGSAPTAPPGSAWPPAR